MIFANEYGELHKEIVEIKHNSDATPESIASLLSHRVCNLGEYGDDIGKRKLELTLIEIKSTNSDVHANAILHYEYSMKNGFFVQI